MYLSFNRSFYEHLYSRLTGSSGPVKSSHLLQTFATLSAMKECKLKAPEAYAYVKNKFAEYRRGLLLTIQQPFADDFESTFYPYVHISLTDFLFHVVPDILFDVSNFISDYSLFLDGISHHEIIIIHHILQVKLTSYQYFAELNAGTIDAHLHDPDLNDKLYAIYRKLEKYHPLSKTIFLKLYLTVNYYRLNQREDLSHVFYFRSSDKCVPTFLSIVFDQLQLTHSQVYEIIADFFIRGKQAWDIVKGEDFSHYSVCNEKKARMGLVRKALIQLCKMTPLEAICAVSKTPATKKERRSQTGCLLSEEIVFENSVIYPLFFSDCSYTGDESILLLFPSPFFVRKILLSHRFCEFRTTIVLEDQNVVDSLIYQANDKTMAPMIGKNISFVSYNDWKIQAAKERYSKILFFGTAITFKTFDSACNYITSFLNNFAVLYILEPSCADHELSLMKFFGSRIKLDSLAVIQQDNCKKAKAAKLFSRYLMFKNPGSFDGTSHDASVYSFVPSEFLTHKVISPANGSPRKFREAELLKMLTNEACGSLDPKLLSIFHKGKRDASCDSESSDTNKRAEGYQQLIKAVLDSSKSKVWEEAVYEWEIYDCEENEECSDTCLCGKHGLRYVYTIHNTVTDEFLKPIGSTCIGKFNREDMSDEITVKEKLFKLSHALENGTFEFSSKYFSNKLLTALFEEGAFKPNSYNGFNAYSDYDFLVKMFNKKDKSQMKSGEAQKVQRILDSSIKPYLVNMFST